jgi:predicted nucleic acid-binding protein
MCDTNVLLRAAISPAGPANELLTILAKDHILVSSAPHLADVYAASL